MGDELNHSAQATDSELVEETLAGDPGAFGPLIDRHMRPTFAVAYALTGSQAESDDLVQDALLNAYQDLPKLRLREKFGQWLAGIVRKLAANRRRSAWRDRRVLRSYAERKEAETDVSFRETVADGPGDLLWDGIKELSEELRVPLLLYYFEGHSTQAVAERLGLQPATARKRLQIARDKLREKLQERWERELRSLGPSPAIRATVLLAVSAIPFTAAAASSTGGEAGAGSNGSISAAAGVQGWKVAAVALVSVVLLILLGTQIPFGDSPSVTEATPSLAQADRAEETAGSKAGTVEKISEATSDSSVATTDTEPPPGAVTGTVIGTVSRSDGESVAGLRVRLARNRAAWSNAEAKVVDTTGAFRFEVRADENYWLYVEVAGARICAPAPWVRVPRSGIIERNIELDAGVTLSGNLLCAETGHPVAGAAVLLKTPHPNQQGEAHVESDTEGRFKVPFLPVGDYQLVIHHPDFTNDVHHVSLSESSSRTWSLAPARPMRLEILGLSEEFHGVRASIALKRLDDSAIARRFRNREDFTLQGTVDDEGILQTRAPAPGTWEVTFFNRLPKYWTRIEVPAGTDPVDHVCDLEVGGTIEGVVTPVESIHGPGEVVLFDLADESAHGHRIAGNFDEHGHFRFDGLPAGDYVVGLKEWLGGWPVEQDQYRWVNTFTGHVQLAPNGHERMQVHLPERSALRFRIDGESSPHPSSHVLLRISPAGEEEFFSFDAHSRTGSAGSGVGVLAIVRPSELSELVLRRLPPGHYRVEAFLDDRRFATREVQISGDEETLISLPLPAPREAVFELVTADGTAPPREVRFQCPPGPSRADFEDESNWRRAHARWLSTASIRDRLGGVNGMTHQVFARFFNDFSGWHFIRSLWLVEMSLEGTRPVEAGMARIDISCTDSEDTLRVWAAGFEPIDVPMSIVRDAEQPVVLHMVTSR